MVEGEGKKKKMLEALVRPFVKLDPQTPTRGHQFYERLDGIVMDNNRIRRSETSR
jgi:hypothetical protein